MRDQRKALLCRKRSGAEEICCVSKIGVEEYIVRLRGGRLGLAVSEVVFAGAGNRLAGGAGEVIEAELIRGIDAWLMMKSSSSKAGTVLRKP